MGIGFWVFGLVVGVLAFLITGVGLDFIERFIPERLFYAILAVLLMFWLRWEAKSVIKEAIQEALKEDREEQEIEREIK